VISAPLTVGNGLPIWLVSALTIDFSLSLFTPVTSIFSTANNGVKIVDRTSSSKEAIEAIETPNAIRRLLEAAVNLFISGDNFERAGLRFSDLRMLFKRLLWVFKTFLGADSAGCFGALLDFEAGALGNPDKFRANGFDCGRFNYCSSASSNSGTIR
jgi:hypothetical protein